MQVMAPGMSGVVRGEMLIGIVGVGGGSCEGLGRVVG